MPANHQDLFGPIELTIIEGKRVMVDAVALSGGRPDITTQIVRAENPFLADCVEKGDLAPSAAIIVRSLA